MTQKWCFLGTTYSCSFLSLPTLDLLIKILILEPFPSLFLPQFSPFPFLACS